MIRKAWKDCRFQADEHRAVLENDVLRTEWSICRSGLSLLCIENKATGFCWRHADGSPAQAPHCMALEGARPVWRVFPKSDALGEDHWVIEFSLQDGERRVLRRMTLFAHCPFLTLCTEWHGFSAADFAPAPVPADPQGIEREPAGEAAPQNGCGDVMVCVPLPHTHLRWEALRFYDQTDAHDTLVSRTGGLVYPPEAIQAAGSLFLVHAPLTGETLFTARHAPICPFAGDSFTVLRETLSILHNGCAGALPDASFGCSCVIGAVRTQDAEREYRAFYRRAWAAPWQPHARMLSNTWGDRNRDSRISEAFLMQEIDRAARMGLDVVQIDDGWQTGRTINSAQPQNGVWEGYYAADADFWKPDAARFPNGLTPIAAYAETRGIRLGLWFSPDSSDEFAHWQRDAETILHLYRAYHASVIKLDGVKLRTPLARRRFAALMQQVLRQSDGHIQLQQDITAEQRLGYFSLRGFGMLFVENRYTDFGSYYPHRTLRNLWMLSRYIPAQRLLIELLNPRRNRDRYPDDPFAPDRYTADYLFAVTMTAQPLFFMELSGLSDADEQSLTKIIAVYRAHRDAMWNCDVQPIGTEPDGQSFPGFLLTDRKKPNEGFLLVFREAAAQDRAAFTGMPHGMRLRLLCANHGVRRLPGKPGRLVLRLDAPRSYAFFRWTAPRG